MVDIEIFVDRIADMRINGMNTMLESSRQQVMQHYNPGENDLHMRTLELAQITEEEKQARLLLKSLGIDYDKLTPEEFVTMINILKKSTHLRSCNNQRGKGGLYPTHGKGNKKRRK